VGNLKTRYRKLATGGAVEAAPIPDAPPPSPAAAAPIPDLVSEDDELSKSELPDSAKNWLRSRPEFLYDETASQRLADLHFKVVDEGLEPYSPAYFRRIEQRLEQPPASGDIDHEAVDRVLAQARRSAPPMQQVEDDAPRIRYSAPPSRQVPNSNGTRAYLDDPRSVVLTREQKEAARFSGVSESEYARQFLELQRRKSLGDFTGQP
jgi:hypothetical protein